jgi:hypothetical protein
MRIFLSCRGRVDAGQRRTQHRDIAMGQHVLRLAAQQQALEAPAAMRRHHDQVALVLLRRGQDRLGRPGRAHGDGLGRHAGLLGRLLHFVGQGLAALAHCFSTRASRWPTP